ncbi:MAG TPA: beta/gamma crystallin-related protein [Polyangiaceae bacterium]
MSFRLVNMRRARLSSVSFVTLLLLASCSAPSEDSESAASSAKESSTIEGEVRVIVIDELDGSSRVDYTLELDGGDDVELVFSRDPQLRARERIRVKGKPSHDLSRGPARMRVEVASYDVLGPAAGETQQALSAEPPRTAKVAVIVLNMDGTPANPVSIAELTGRLAEVRRYYQEISYGQWNVEGAVFGPVTMPRPANCELRTIRDAGRVAAQAEHIPVDSFDHLSFVLPEDTGLSCHCGVAYLGRPPADPRPVIEKYSYVTCTGSNAIAHELGHAFGLRHAATVSCGGQPYASEPYNSAVCNFAEYGNRFNTMGNGLGHMNAYQKSTMKWLQGCNTVRVNRDGIFDVAPIQASTTGLQALQVPTFDSHEGAPLFFYVEYRNPAPATFNTSFEKRPGVHVTVAPDFLATSAERRTLLLDLARPMSSHQDARLTEGGFFRHPNGRVLITVLETSAEKARIEIKFSDGGSGAIACLDGSAPPVPASDPKAQLFQHCSYGGTSVPLNLGGYSTRDLIALGGRDNDASSISLAQGYQARLYDSGFFTGTLVTARENNSCVTNFNDRTSSVRIEKVPQARFFQHCNYLGYQVALGEGSYDASALAARGITNNDLSSLQVPWGFEAVLYDGDSFTGDSRILTAEKGCLVDSAFNDRTSSLIIRPVTR